MESYKFEQGDYVWFNNPGALTGWGTIMGCSSTPIPVLGRMWIVHMDTGCHDGNGVAIPNDTYPFKCVTVAECHLGKAT